MWIQKWSDTLIAMKKMISIVIPAYNEEAVIDELVKRLTKLADSLHKYSFEFIFVENGSSDNTFLELLKARKRDKRVKILKLVKNATCDGGIVAGLTFASGNAAVVMMADLQDPPELIIKFLKKWEEGYHIVYGIVSERKNLRVTRKLGTFIFYKLMNIITSGLLPENVSDFRLMDRKAYKIITSLPEHNKFFRGLAIWTGFKEIGIPFERPQRYAGESKAHFLTVLNVAINGIISFSSIPLRMFWVFVGFLFLFTVVVLIKNVNTFAITLCILTILAFMIGVIGEYTLRIFEEVRNRPNFIIQDVYGLHVD